MYYFMFPWHRGCVCVPVSVTSVLAKSLMSCLSLAIYVSFNVSMTSWLCLCSCQCYLSVSEIVYVMCQFGYLCVSFHGCLTSWLLRLGVVSIFSCSYRCHSSLISRWTFVTWCAVCPCPCSCRVSIVDRFLFGSLHVTVCWSMFLMFHVFV